MLSARTEGNPGPEPHGIMRLHGRLAG